MESLRRWKFSIFTLVYVLIGISGINISGAATTKHMLPSAPTNVTAIGGLNSATLKWKAPSSNGGQRITSYKVIYHPGEKLYVCKSSATSCKVPIANPDKPSSKPAPVWFYFTVAAVNSVGTGPQSIVGHARVLVRFRATIYIAPKYGTQTPVPIATANPSSAKVTAFDGSYIGQVNVVVTPALAPTNVLTSTIPLAFAVQDGHGVGNADAWKADGYVTDAAGVASVTVTNPIYGSLSFVVNFAEDPVTKIMSGTGKGTKTFEIAGLGSIFVEFTFNVSRPT